MLFTKATALLGALAFPSLAAAKISYHVFTYFYDNTHWISAPLTDTSYDVANKKCFSVENATQVSFSQAGIREKADGPYCLHGFDEPDCAGHEHKQEFSHVYLDLGFYEDRRVNLTDGVRDAASFHWQNCACDKTCDSKPGH